MNGAIGRIALREEGDEWRAYYALPNTMRDALFLGSINMGLVRGNEDRKRAFMNLMRDVAADFIEKTVGIRPEWNREKPAPFWERGDG